VYRHRHFFRLRGSLPFLREIAAGLRQERDAQQQQDSQKRRKGHAALLEGKCA
jgi:hypothetical protein